MERAKLTTLAVDRAHRSGKPMLLSDGDGLYLRKQTRDELIGRTRSRGGGSLPRHSPNPQPPRSPLERPCAMRSTFSR